ncbi:CPBP family intramembrane glutamic endopeptidase [Apilactobacillus nanyangensis]|uniref:CPBP family intramembrane glutamic endopeptidase n=1 Tax=Apilactobacillus nanyangensis TaxID=2799579 RepID=UPI001941E11A|nr:CPBP family intramembrane glutamic endopeptidase [Apilactobacillus nanyangensis]
MLNQKIKDNWKWILIPIILIAELLIDDYVMPHVYKFVFHLVAFNPVEHFYTYLNIYKIVSIIVICLLNYWIIKQKIFFKPSETKMGWLVFLVVCFTIVMATIEHKNFFIALDVGAIAALPEEIMFRGIILAFVLKLMTRKSTDQWRIILSLVISALIFGGFHYINLSSQSFSFTSLQVVNAAALGMILGAVYIKSGTIIVPMALHFIYDFLVTLVKGMSATNYTSVQSMQWVGLSVYVVIYSAVALSIINYKPSDNKILPKLKNL